MRRTEYVLPFRLVQGSWQFPRRALLGQWTAENTATTFVNTSCPCIPPVLPTLYRLLTLPIVSCIIPAIQRGPLPPASVAAMILSHLTKNSLACRAQFSPSSLAVLWVPCTGSDNGGQSSSIVFGPVFLPFSLPSLSFYQNRSK